MKTLLFLNLRFANFYSETLFKEVKENHSLRIVVILDQQFKDKIPPHLAPYIDELYFVAAEQRNGFLAEFNLDTIRPFIEKEFQQNSNLKIICSDEFNLLNAGQLRREYKLHGHTEQDLLPFRDKVMMKAILAEQGIRVPKFKLLHASDDYHSLAQQIGLPFILKPIDSCGSHGVYKIENEWDYNQFLEASFSQFDTFEVEEFIQGKLYHIDSYTCDQEIQFICANEYTFPNHEYTQGKVLGSIPLDVEAPLSQRLIDFAKQSLLAFGSKNLINHMELFVNEQNEIVFLEVSARPPGALVNLSHALNFGVNLIDEDFYLQADILSKKEIQPIPHEKVFWAIFPLIPGKVTQLNPPVVQSRLQLHWFVNKDRIINKSECESIVEKAAHAIFYHADTTVLRDDFERIKAHQVLVVK